MIKMEIKCIQSKSALSKTTLPGLDYSLNPYRGCGHGCLYCYAPAVLREKRQWGSFVDVKENLPQVLEKELEKKEKGLVGIGTVTDAYQPVESRYLVTRNCLEKLLARDWPVCVQTKSALVARDFDLLAKFSHAEVGVTIAMLDDSKRALYEPGASPIEARFSVLEKAKGAGLETWVFLGPVIPGVTENGLEELIRRIAGAGAKRILFDRLRFHPGVRERMGVSTGDKAYFDGMDAKITRICGENGIRCGPAFG